MSDPANPSSASVQTVSVVMPVYNASRTVQYAIRSVLSQRGVQVQLVICDDASTDGSDAVAQGIGDPRVTFLRNESNQGPGAARDRAIAHVSTPWVGFIDADDAWHPERLRHLVTAADALGADVVFDDILLCHDTPAGPSPWKRLRGRTAFGESGSAARQVPVSEYIKADRLLAQPIIRTDVLRKHHILHTNRRFAEDAEYYLRVGLAGAKFAYVPRPLYLYRITPGSLTTQAADPTLMRKCLEECSQWGGWPDEAMNAFAIKIASLRRSEAIHRLAYAVKYKQFRKAAQLIYSNPWLLKTTLSKVLTQSGYQAHRLWAGGRAR